MIPKIIHQSWKVEDVPERWRGFQESWRRNHPNYEYRFWTDADNRAFIKQIFPDFLAVYDGYRHPISRADLARCLVVSHHGGVYADLDCESLRPLDDLLHDKALIFGLEPQSHVDKPAVASRGFKRILCNAVFASVPGHPFWRHLFPLVKANKDEGNVLEAAGPFVITRAFDSYPHQDEVAVLPSRVFYPIDHFLRPTGDDTPEDRPYTVHHWAGTWWRAAVINNARSRILSARARGGGEGG